MSKEKIKRVVVCAQPFCKAPLWSFEILDHYNEKVISSEWNALKPGLPKTPEKVDACPVCGLGYWQEADDGHRQYHVVDPKTGKTSVI